MRDSLNKAKNFKLFIAYLQHASENLEKQKARSQTALTVHMTNAL
jgi:hypothetical protein